MPPKWEFRQPRKTFITYLILNIVTTLIWFPLYYLEEWFTIPLWGILVIWIVITVVTTIAWWRIVDH